MSKKKARKKAATKPRPNRLTKLTQHEAGYLLGITDRQVRNLAVPRNEDGSYDARELLLWKVEQTQVAELEDVDVDSPGLERYRLAKAQLAELELAERRGQVVKVDAAKDVLTRWADVLRRLAATMKQQFGREAEEHVFDAIDDCEHVLQDFDASSNTDSADS